MADQKTPTKLLPGNIYQGLGYGPETHYDYEEQPVERRPVEGSRSFLRQLSPFRLSLVLPDSYGNLRRADGTASFTRDLEQKLDPSSRVRTEEGLAEALAEQQRQQQLEESGTGDLDYSGEDAQALAQELERSSQERGVGTGQVPLTRAIGRPYINDQYDRLYDAAHTRYDSYEEAKQAAKSRAQFEQTYTHMGASLAHVDSGRFIVNGEERSTTLDPADPRGVDKNTALDIATQLLEMMRVPPLVLLVNPSSLSISRSRVIQFSERTKYGFLLQDWGGEQITLSITVKCGAFISGGRGVQYASKRDSASWQNLMQLVQIYKNNGHIFDRLGGSYAMHSVGSVAIEYDGWVYVGSFESLSYSYDEGSPNGGVEFSMEFIVNDLYDNAPPVTGPLGPMNSVTKVPFTSPYYLSNNLRKSIDQAEAEGGIRALFGLGQSSSPSETEGDGTETGATEEELPVNSSGFDLAEGVESLLSVFDVGEEG